MFHPLRVSEVERLTDDSVAVTFAVPPELRETFRHTPGQHVALRRVGDGDGIRRTYSICAPADEHPVLRVGIRLVEGGEFSTYALKELAEGDTVDVMEPTGRFVLTPRAGYFAAIVGGSGITPVLSIASTLLAREPEARFCLIRSDRTVASTMFLEEVADLKDRYPDRFQLVTVVSREEQQTGLTSGRLDEERLAGLLPALLSVDSVDGWFLCGPFGLVTGAERALRTLGVRRKTIHQEIFHVDDALAPPAPAATRPVPAGGSTLTATLDGRSGSWPVQEGSPCWRRCCAAAPTRPTRARAASAAPAGPSSSPARSGWTATSPWSRRRPRRASSWPASPVRPPPRSSWTSTAERRPHADPAHPRTAPGGRNQDPAGATGGAGRGCGPGRQVGAPEAESGVPGRQRTKAGVPLSVTIGQPAPSHACIPPSTFTASIPCPTRYWVTCADRPPTRHMTKALRPSATASVTSPKRATKSLIGTCSAPSTWPAAHSSSSRTSSTRPSEGTAATSTAGSWAKLM